MSAGTLPKKVYFENLNAIRFIAASLVYVHHVEQLKNLLHLPSAWENHIINALGSLGVLLFFVLSGFLISYLLFEEQVGTGTISINYFYIRRILRIWPLYFLIIIAALFIIPFIKFLTIDGYGQDVVWRELPLKIGLYVFFLPNMVLTLIGIVPYASQTWSIGAEEQFYIFWPYLNKKIKNKWLLIVGVIIAYITVKLAAEYVLHENNYMRIFRLFLSTTPIDCMAIGGVFAMLIRDHSPWALKVKDILFSKSLQWLALIGVIAMVYFGAQVPFINNEFYALFFGILICNFAVNPNRIFSMEFQPFTYLGKVSYGLYMYHPLAIVLCIKLLQSMGVLNNWLLYPTAFITVVLISSVSFELFEKWFINKKIKYSKVISGDTAKEG